MRHLAIFTTFVSVLITSIRANTYSYLRCNDIYTQREYFENERRLFDTTIDKAPFEMDNIFNNTLYVPSNCIKNNTMHVSDKMFSVFMLEQSKLTKIPPMQMDYPTIINKIVWKFTDKLWYLTGWQKIIEYGEHYWYYPNHTSNKTTFYLHGVNILNGYENIMLLNTIQKSSSVYISIYSPVMLAFPNYDYNNTLSEHVDNLATFINNKKTTSTEIVGNSYGSVRATILCKRYSSICNQAERIILTDPLTINLPFSIFTKMSIYGALLFHPTETPIYSNIKLINFLRQEKYYNIIVNQHDWYESTIDTIMMKQFSKNLILIIGKYDIHIETNPNVEAMQLCRVIYTNTLHGMVIFSNFYKYL